MRLFGEDYQFGEGTDCAFVLDSDIVTDLKVGAKAAVNATSSTIVSTLTLGIKENARLLEVTEDDLARGYEASEGTIRVGTEIAAGVLMGGAGKAGKVGKIFGAMDVGSNAVSVAKGSADIVQNGANAGNVLQVLAGGGGLLGNYAGMRRASNAPGSGGNVVLRSKRSLAWADEFGKPSSSDLGTLIRDLPKGHKYRKQMAEMLWDIRRRGGKAKMMDLGGIAGEHIPGNVGQSFFRYNPAKLRAVDFVEEAAHWQQIQRGLHISMKGGGGSLSMVQKLEVLAKQRVLQEPGLPLGLRKEFLMDIQDVLKGNY